MRRDPYDAFAAAVTAAGLKPRQCSAVHWRVEGGAFDVNFYPTKGSIFINGMHKRHKRGDVQDAIDAAKSGPDRVVPGAERKRLKGIKLRFLRRTRKCHWCPVLLTPQTATIDHVIPLSKGGSNSEDNLVLACEPCNKRRGNEIGSRKVKAGSGEVW